MRKNRLLTGALALCIAALLMVPAAAHGHRRAASCVEDTCPVCPVEDCTLSGRHCHDGETYCGNYHADGLCAGGCETYTPPVRHHGHGGHHC